MKKVEESIENIFVKHRWTVHMLFWTSIILLYILFFGQRNNHYLFICFFVGLLTPVLVGTTYFVNYFLIPHFLLRGRYLFFLLYFTYTILGSLFLESIIVLTTFIMIAQWKIQKMTPLSINVSFLLVALLMVVFLAMAIKLLLHWKNSKENYQRVLLEKVEMELKFLKSQLNPHFLFNTLNNLYYLTSMKSEKAPQAILSLSQLLDYVMNSGKQEFIDLNEEIEQTRNFIALESLRYEDRLSVDFSASNAKKSLKIPPMTLISLVENSFKHGVMKSAKNAWIRIHVLSNNDCISICIDNNKNPMGTTTSLGIGLENLRNQLRLLYPQRHELKILNNNESFSLNLVLYEEMCSN